MPGSWAMKASSNYSREMQANVQLKEQFELAQTGGF